MGKHIRTERNLNIPERAVDSRETVICAAGFVKHLPTKKRRFGFVKCRRARDDVLLTQAVIDASNIAEHIIPSALIRFRAEYDNDLGRYVITRIDSAPVQQ